MNLNVQSAMNQTSVIEVRDLFQFSKQNGQKYAFITNDGTFHDLFDASEAEKETGVTAKLGAKFPFRIGQNVVVLALYPKNNWAKKALCSLSSKYHKNQKRNLGLEGRKAILKEMAIVIDSEGIDSKAVKETIRTLKSMVFENNTSSLFVGLHETFTHENKEENLQIRKVLETEKVKFVPFNNVKFLTEEQIDNFNYLMSIKKSSLADDTENMMLKSEDIEEMFDYMEMENGINALVSMIKADFIYKQEDIKMPNYPVPEGFQLSQKFKDVFSDFIEKASDVQIKSAGYLFNLVFTGLMKKYGRSEKAVERALKELKVIIEKNFADYFLIVWDFIKYSKENGILIGPGRGSVAGSIVAYCLDITEACPLTYNLQFERFLNIFRKDMPDIDVDVSQKTRDKLIRYLRNKYGQQFVSHIITRSNYGFKKIISNLLKQMRVPEDKLKAMWDLKPEKFETLNEFLTKEPEAKVLMEASKDIRVLLEQGYALKNFPETTSTHAAGILISSVPLEEEIPMMYDDNGNLITQVTNDTEVNSLEKMGFLKFDILGLRNLDIIQRVKELVEKRTGKPFPQINLNDAKTLKLIREATNMGGIFQLESESAKNVLKQIGIECFLDIVITNAMNRPGPLDFVSFYAMRKGKPVCIVDEKGNKMHGKGIEELYPVLEETNGFIVFQEQINEIVTIWSHMELASAELFRKAISKKNRELLIEEGRKFIDSAVAIGRDKQTTEEIFKIILRFAKFGFNKSHAVVYSMITFTLAYLKAHFPLEFYAALMTSVATNNTKVVEYISEARNNGIEILPPDINKSSDEFTIEGNSIRCALQMVKDVGLKSAQGILEARKEIPFKHIYDVMKRIKLIPAVDKGNLEALAKVGAFDSINERHEVIAFLQEKKGNITPYTTGEKLVFEAQGCGVIFSINQENRIKLDKVTLGKENVVVGVLTAIKMGIDKYKRAYARLNLVSLDGNSYNPFVFNKQWLPVKDTLTIGSMVLAELDDGKVKKIKTVNML